MDLVPKPDQLVAAAGNAVHLLLHGGLADLRPMPRALVDEGTLREVHHYRPDPVAAKRGDPVLLVPPLAAPAGCFDLRRGCSLVEHLVGNGRPTYLVEYGDVSFPDPNLGLEHWAQEIVPAAVRAVSEHAGGRPVHVVGWSLGGIFAMLAAADVRDLPVASLSVLGSPVDTTSVPMVAPLRPLLTTADWPAAVGRTYRALGGAPPLVRWAFQLGSFQRLVTKPIAVAVHLDDADWLAQVEAVDRFAASMTAYPGRSFGQLYHRFAVGNALATGTVELGDRPVSLAAITAPTLVFAGATDGIAPVESVRAALPLLTGAREARFEIVPGGHLGMLAGRAARETTWRALDEWFEQWDGRRRPTRRGATKKATPQKSAPKAPAKAPTKASSKKTPAKKAAPRKASAEPTAAPEGAIGTHPRRRHSSSGSRALRR
ncbi:alpha/beta fold hydrolase [Nocardioides soli]|uniref:Polyhydroxyalkanoate synthase n=1 Tax=Nocardioides soli TaxID=1036020 RepID=A0A7W4VUR3_9ACTN|nr:alpha/beta fold hydrolase [Nocardioides soli]MBB3042145.1 polyhydroxyalkanoate synthase [Nocardioides soli]